LLVVEARTGADAEVTVCVTLANEVWLAVAVLVVVTGVLGGEVVNVRVDVLGDMDGVTTVVTTMRFVEATKFWVEVVTIVMAVVAVGEATPIKTYLAYCGDYRMKRVILHPTVAQTSPGIQQPPPTSLPQGVLPATH